MSDQHLFKSWDNLVKAGDDSNDCLEKGVILAPCVDENAVVEAKAVAANAANMEYGRLENVVYVSTPLPHLKSQSIEELWKSSFDTPKVMYKVRAQQQAMEATPKSPDLFDDASVAPFLSREFVLEGGEEDIIKSHELDPFLDDIDPEDVFFTSISTLSGDCAKIATDGQASEHQQPLELPLGEKTPPVKRLYNDMQQSSQLLENGGEPTSSIECMLLLQNQNIADKVNEDPESLIIQKNGKVITPGSESRTLPKYPLNRTAKQMKSDLPIVQNFQARLANTDLNMGFSTASGRSIKPPSEAAIKEALGIINKVTGETKHANRVDIDGTYDYQRERANDSTAASSTISTNPTYTPTLGFSTAGGKFIKPPSEASIKKAMELSKEPFTFVDTEPIKSPIGALERTRHMPKSPIGDQMPASMHNHAVSETVKQTFSVRFSTAGGKTVPNPSKEALVKANRLFNTVVDSAELKIDEQGSAGEQANNSYLDDLLNTASTKKPEQLARVASTPKTPIPCFRSVQTPTSNIRNSLPKPHVSQSIKANESGMKQNTPFRPPSSYKQKSPLAVAVKKVQKRLFILNTGNNIGSRKKLGSLKAVAAINSNDHAFLPIDKAILYMNYTIGLECKLFENTFGHSEAYEQLLGLGANDQSISKVWVQNHFGLIVWKICSMIRNFPSQLPHTFLSKETILDQLCYRYEREVNQCERSILKKIVERDDGPSGVHVLVVAAIRRVGDSKLIGKPTTPSPGKSLATESFDELLLSDGWYSIWTIIDKKIAELIAKEKIFIGQKLAIFSPQLVSNDAVSILEADANSVRLKIGINSIKRARWDRKLGKQKVHGFYMPIGHIQMDGGMVSCIKCIIMRVYPVMYLVYDGSESRPTLKTLREYSLWIDGLVGGSNDWEERTKISVIRILRCRVMDLCRQGKPQFANLSIKQPTEELLEKAKEGSAITVYACRPVFVKHGKMICLETIKSSIILFDPTQNNELLRHHVRNPLTEFEELTDAEPEVDLVGRYIGFSSDRFIWLLVSQRNLVAIEVSLRFKGTLSLLKLVIGEMIMMRDVLFSYKDPKLEFLVFSATEFSEMYKNPTTESEEHLWKSITQEVGSKHISEAVDKLHSIVNVGQARA